MRTSLSMGIVVAISLILAGCLDQFAPPSGSPGTAGGAPSEPPDRPPDDVDPTRWGVDPETGEAAYLGAAGAGGPLDRQASLLEEERLGHCGGPPADPRFANAIGTATAVKIRSELLLEVEITHSTIAVEQNGPGVSEDEEQLMTIRVPDPTGQRDHLVRAEVAAVAARSEVNVTDFESRQRTEAELLNVSVLDGTVRADVLRAEGSTNASSDRAEWSTNGSVMAGVEVAGGHHVSAKPWFRVDLSDVFGEGSYVSFFETVGHIHRPMQPVDGFAADVMINMVRVVLTDSNPITPTEDTVDIILSQVWSHSDFPEDPACRDIRGVHGHAYNLHVTHSLPAQPITLGLVNLPILGGDEEQHLNEVEVGSNHARTAGSRVQGEREEDRSWARGEAEVEDLCLLEGATGCVVSASLVRVESFAEASANGSLQTEASVVIVDLRVLGVEACPTLNAENICRPEPGTVIPLPGLGNITLNEQFKVDTESPECHTGITVRGIHVRLFSESAHVIVSEAESGAFFCPPLHDPPV